MLQSQITLSTGDKNSISTLRLFLHRNDCLQEAVAWCRRYLSWATADNTNFRTKCFKPLIGYQLRNDMERQSSECEQEQKINAFQVSTLNSPRFSKASFIDYYEYWAALAYRLKPLVYSTDWSGKIDLSHEKSLCFCLWRTKMSSVALE